MSCNAHNHRLGCACGFGGEKPDLPTFEDGLGLKKVVRKAKARLPHPCPACGKPVYFIRTERGGRFFLNAPDDFSSKHECDGLRRPRRPRIRQSQWRREAWLPVSLTPASGHVPGMFEARCLTGELNCVILVIEGSLQEACSAMFREQPAEPTMIEIGFLDLDGELMAERILARRI